MKILSAAAIREWDQYTIEQEPILSVDLMERAAGKCTEWILRHYPDATSFSVFCGKGNNGGDGLAIARQLLENNYAVSVYILEFGHKGTDDFQTNLALLHKLPNAAICFIQEAVHFHPFAEGEVVIDALLGSGINRHLEGLTAQLVTHINSSGHPIIAIDIPSGLFSDTSTKGELTIQATHTLTFQCYKPAFLLAENADALGDIQLLDIGLHPGYSTPSDGQLELVDDDIIHAIYKPRPAFAHKGDCGHALLVAGSYGKMGAAVLAARACLRGGVGLLTCHVPQCGYTIVQTAVPEAMVDTDADERINTGIDSNADLISRYDVIGAGPGLGTAAATITLLEQLFAAYHQPMVLDADALNGIALQPALLQKIPAGSILTPHPKEFERLFGTTANEFERIALAKEKAAALQCVIVLKGHHTFIATPGGQGYFNATGNAGMATGGSGDVLTGLLTALLAGGYPSEQAAVLGVYLHGLSGDLAAKDLSQEAMVAGDIVEYLGKAFLRLSR